MFSKVVFFVVAVVLFGAIFNANAEDRIIGGTKIEISEAPYIVRIFRNNRFICGGTLVDPRYVVTATHCIIDNETQKFEVHAGSTARAGKGVRRKVVNFILNPRYNQINKDRDVAVLKLDGPLVGNNVETIKLCTKAPPASSFIRVLGWGRTSENSSPADELFAAQVQVLAQDTCQQLYKEVKLSENQFCAMDSGKDACKGDSGGPAVFNNTLVGIVSWGIGCGRKNRPGIYTRVDTVRPFITASIGELSKLK